MKVKAPAPAPVLAFVTPLVKNTNCLLSNVLTYRMSRLYRSQEKNGVGYGQKES